MQDIKYSVIIPCFNGKPFLKDCLESLANQSFQSFEIIFIDDNSPDGSYEEALRLQEVYGLKGKILKKSVDIKKGVSSSRNLGLSLAKGEWLVFLDCDDYFATNKMEVINNFINDNPSSFAIHHAYIKFDDRTALSNPIIVNHQIKHDFDFLVHDNPIGTSTVTVKKSVIEKMGGFNTSLNGIEDYFLWCRIAKHFGPWDYIPELLVHYRYLPDSLMSQRNLSYYVGQVEGFYLEAIRSNEFSNAELDLIYHKFFYQQLSYRVDISLQFYGWMDFFKGLKLLIQKNHTPVAFFYLKQRLKNHSLYWADFYFKSLKKKLSY